MEKCGFFFFKDCHTKQACIFRLIFPSNICNIPLQKGEQNIMFLKTKNSLLDFFLQALNLVINFEIGGKFK